jgi:ubiquinone/menaquinone biosynthesis C-methylase UbiE
MKQKKDWEEFFDHHAPEYMDNVFTKNTAAEIKFLVEELQLPEGSSILDIGCGTGRHSVGLAMRGYKVTGIDMSSGMLDEARKAADKANVKVEFIHADASEYKPQNQYDAAICLCEGAFALIGMDEDPLTHDLAILRNINRALKADAKFIQTTLNGLEKIRKYTKEDIEKGVFDPYTLVETVPMEYETPEGKKSVMVSEKGYVASELKLVLSMAGFETLNIYGGTAGNWGRRVIDPDEIEIMAIARKSSGR